MTDEQARRRQRVVTAVLEIAEQGGYDAVQLREVSVRSGVSLRTIYKYFSSREELLVAAMTEWRDEVTAESLTRIRGRSFEDRVLALYRHGFDTFSKSPKLFETFMRLQWEANVGNLDWGRAAVYARVDEELEAFDEEFASDFRMIVGNVMFAGFHEVAMGLFTFDQVWSSIERTVRRLAQGAPPRTPAATD